MATDLQVTALSGYEVTGEDIDDIDQTIAELWLHPMQDGVLNKRIIMATPVDVAKGNANICHKALCQTDFGSPSKVAMKQALHHERAELENNKLEEEMRLDYLLRTQKTMNETFSNESWLHPHGMTAYDCCAIPDSRLETVQNYKMSIRRQNYRYIQQHPELDALFAVFVKKLLKARPRDSVRFAAEFFSFRRIKQDELIQQMDAEVKKIKHFQNPSGRSSDDLCAEKKAAWKDLNEVKTLSVGPMSQYFGETPPQSARRKRRFRKIQKCKSPKKKHVYCGCKDSNRRTHEKSELVKQDDQVKTDIANN